MTRFFFFWLCLFFQTHSLLAPQLARQKSSRATLKSFVEFEQHADTLRSDTVSFRFNHKHIDMVLAMQSSRLVTHSQANQGAVACDMREFKHPVSGRDAVLLQVKTRLQKPINFEVTFRCVNTCHAAFFVVAFQDVIIVCTQLPQERESCQLPVP